MQIVTELSSVKQIHLIFLCRRHIMPQVFSQQCIDPLCLAVCLRMICCVDLQLRTQELEEFHPKASCESIIPIADHVLRQAKVFHHMTEKQIGCLFCWTCLRCCHEYQILGESINHNKDGFALMMKSMETLCHGFSSMGRGCSNPAIFSSQSCPTDIPKDFMYACASSPILGQ